MAYAAGQSATEIETAIEAGFTASSMARLLPLQPVMKSECPLSTTVVRTHAKFTPHRPTTSTNSGTSTDVAMPFSPTAIPANVPAS